MRACFLGQNICALGYGVAMVQSPQLREPETDEAATFGEILPPARAFENPMARDLKRQAIRLND